MAVETIKPKTEVSSHPLINTKLTARTSVRRATKRIPSWQERLLPLMSKVLIGLAIFFFIATFFQMSYLHWSMLQTPTIDVNSLANADLIALSQQPDNQLTASELLIRTRLETYIIQQRYHHAIVLLMYGLWIRYLGFITGMVMAFIGATFILGKLREPTQKIEGKISEAQLSLITTSPGVILVVIGFVLMLTTIFNRGNFEVTDGSVYFSGLQASGVPSEVIPASFFTSPTEVMLSTPQPVQTQNPLSSP